MKILMFAASLRKDSLNKKLIRYAHGLLSAAHDVSLKEFSDYDMPLYNGDIEATTGLPAGAQTMIADVLAADAIVISSPEYNFGIPGTFKNALDWTSRARPQPWNGKQVLLMGASPSMVGTNRGLWQVRQTLEAMSVFAYPDMFGLAQADKAFDEEGQLKDEKLKSQFEKLLKKFTDYAT